jgi:hypothetical protein
MKRVATLCLILSLLSFGQYCVDEYNHSVKLQEIYRQNKASGIEFGLSDCRLRPDYPERNRFLILLLSVAAFFVMVSVRRRRLAMLVSLFLYSLCALLAYQWIAWVVDSLQIGGSYHFATADIRRHVSTFDWLMLAGLALTIVVNAVLLNREIDSTARMPIDAFPTDI